MLQIPISPGHKILTTVVHRPQTIVKIIVCYFRESARKHRIHPNSFPIGKYYTIFAQLFAHCLCSFGYIRIFFFLRLLRFAPDYSKYREHIARRFLFFCNTRDIFLVYCVTEVQFFEHLKKLLSLKNVLNPNLLVFTS